MASVGMASHSLHGTADCSGGPFSFVQILQKVSRGTRRMTSPQDTLTTQERLRVWAASGVSVTLAPDTLRAMANLIDGAHEAHKKAVERYDEAQRDLLRSALICALTVLFTVVSHVVAL